MVLDASCRISYRSNAPIPAIMMLRPRSGYAQWITISLTRSLNIPERMVIFIRLNLWTFTPGSKPLSGGAGSLSDGTQERPHGNRINIGYGRDAADVALTSNYGALEPHAVSLSGSATGRLPGPCS
jgi:hypothetical protein